MLHVMCSWWTVKPELSHFAIFLYIVTIFLSNGQNLRDSVWRLIFGRYSGVTPRRSHKNEPKGLILQVISGCKNDPKKNKEDPYLRKISKVEFRRFQWLFFILYKNMNGSPHICQMHFRINWVLMLGWGVARVGILSNVKFFMMRTLRRIKCLVSFFIRDTIFLPIAFPVGSSFS